MSHSSLRLFVLNEFQNNHTRHKQMQKNSFSSKNESLKLPKLIEMQILQRRLFKKKNQDWSKCSKKNEKRKFGFRSAKFHSVGDIRYTGRMVIWENYIKASHGYFKRWKLKIFVEFQKINYLR